MKHVGVLAGLVAVTVAVVGFNVGYLDHVKAKENDMLTPPTASTTTSDSSQSLPLVADMNSAIGTQPDLQTSATLIDLDTGQTYSAGDTTRLYKAASTAKVLAAVDYLHEVEQGTASLSQSIDGTPVKELLQQMIEVSNDQDWTDLNDYLGNQQQTYATSIGLSSFTGGEYNTMTAADEAKLLAELAQGKLINSSDQALLYGYMNHTTSTNLIQAALPNSATVYHKYGQLWGYINDAAIVDYQGHHFVLVVFTNNTDGTSDDYANQVSLIHAITTAAFNDIVDSKS